MDTTFSKTCPACGNSEQSQAHRKQRQLCSAKKKQAYEEYIKTDAYKNEMAALKATSQKKKKAMEVPFAHVYDRRGVPLVTQYL